MIRYNYLAPSVNTPLDSNSICTSEKLSSFINNNTNTLYHCYYDLEKRDTFVDYKGLLTPVFDSIYIDLDDDETKGELAFTDAKNLCQLFRENDIDFTLYFSGNKGFHISIHKDNFEALSSPLPSDEMQEFVKAFVFGLKAKYKTVDNRIWNSNRKFRAAGSRHEKSGLYKTLLYPGHKVSSMTLEQIRTLASVPVARAMIHPKSTAKKYPIILREFVEAGKLLTNSTGFTGKKAELKEVPQGQMVDDQSMKYRTLKDKPCILGMLDSRNPSFNRHDIGMRIITDLHATGLTLEQAESKISSWSQQTYSGDTERIKDTLRMLRDTYSKPQDYRFGCYDEIKQAYCSAKCKIYKALDPRKRAQPLDVTVKQMNENGVRDNPNLELSEGELADSILKNFGKEIVKSDSDFFFWEGTHWERMDRDRAQAAFYTLAATAYQNQAQFNKIESLVKQIKIKIPVAPEKNHFYTSSSNLFNFTDGTVEVTKNPDGAMQLNLREHNRADLLGYCAPFPFQGDIKLPRNGQTAKYFESRTVDLGASGVRMMKQMLGAALIPYKPWIFFLIGDSDSGKSTMALMIKSLLGDRNVSSVEPVKTGNSFIWEGSLGKIANIATELPKDAPLDVNTLKKVRDKTPQFVNRKGIKGVDATLPFLHIYCANILPASFEGNTGALDNRMSVIKFKKVYVNGLADIDNLGQWLWDHDGASILEYAREGLADLVASGFKYFRSEQSLEHLTDWQDTTDPVKQFVQDVEHGETKLVAKRIESNGQCLIKGQDIYSIYKEWATRCGYKTVGLGKFYAELERCGVGKPKRVSEGRAVLWQKAFAVDHEPERF